MVVFTCNICGSGNRVEKFVTEPATCGCGSNVRLRALMHLVSLELFGRSLFSQPFIARKEPFLLNAAAQAELVMQWRTARAAQQSAEATLARMTASRWLRLGRRLGLGPQID